MYGLMKTLERAAPPLRVGIDNSTVIRGLRRGRRWCCSPKRPHADLWDRVWFLLPDSFPGDGDFAV
eukprot:7899044-Pyramimonas_sp.AAC.1